MRRALIDHPKKRRVVSSKASFMELRPHYVFDFTPSQGFSRSVIPEMTKVPDFEGQPFLLDLSALASLAGRELLPEEVDVLHVIRCLHLADRFAPRHPQGKTRLGFWRRSIFVRVAVSNTDVWKANSESLGLMLKFLTEDDWEFEFLPGRPSTNAETQPHLHGVPIDYDWVSLFSGGLDGLVGVIERVENKSGRGLLVSGVSSSRMKADQEDLYLGLRSAGATVDWIPQDYQLPRIVERTGMESTQRCRAIMHCGLGALVLRLVGLNELLLFENGIGAFNLPCDASQMGSQNSKASHPIFLDQFSKLVSALLQYDISIKNPYLFETKGQMLKEIDSSQWRTHLFRSVSCDIYPNYKSKCRFVDRLDVAAHQWTELSKEFTELYEMEPDLEVSIGATEPNWKEKLCALLLCFAQEWKKLNQHELDAA